MLSAHLSRGCCCSKTPTHCGKLSTMQASRKDSAAVKERIKQQFEQRAAAYDADNSYHPPLARKLLDLCQLQQGEAFLDLACGTGLLALSAAATVGPTGRVVGVDLSPAMLQQAEAKAAAAGLLNTRFICGDIEDLSHCLPADLLGSFDAAAISAAAPFLTEPQQTLASWRQWLKPGARLALNAFVPPALQGYEAYIKVAQEQYGLFGEVDPSATLGSTERVTSALGMAGYSDIQVMPETNQRWIAAASPEQYAEKLWQMALNNNPFRAPEHLQAELGDARLAAFKDDIIAAIASSLSGSDRFDARRQQVSSTCTVLHVVARA